MILQVMVCFICLRSRLHNDAYLHDFQKEEIDGVCCAWYILFTLMGNHLKFVECSGHSAKNTIFLLKKHKNVQNGYGELLMLFRILYRTADISSLWGTLDKAEIYISCSLHKFRL